MGGTDLTAARRRAGGALAALSLAAAAAAQAGHVVELGRYRYDPDRLRPQLRIEERVDDWRFEVSGYPGDPKPGEEVEFQVTVADARGGGAVPGRVEAAVHRIDLLGRRRRIVDRRGPDADGGRFRIALPDDAEYEATFAAAGGEGRPSALSFRFVVGRPGSPWIILGGFGGGIGAFIAGVVVAGRVRGRRPRGTRA